MIKRVQKNKSNSLKKGILMSLCPLAAIYLGMSAYFINHFYFGTTVNSVNVAGKNIDEANEELAAQVKDYSIKLEGRNDSRDEIKGTDINLTYNPGVKLEELKESQHPLAWIVSVFKKEDIELDGIVSYDDNLLNAQIDELSVVKNKKVENPENASFEYGDNGFEIIDEVKGNKIDKDVLHENIYKAIMEGHTTLNLEESYVKPKYTSDSAETLAAKDELDGYAKTKVTYDFGDKSEVLDGEKISEWLGVDDDMNVQFDESKVRSYVEGLARKYNTFGGDRKFTTSTGKQITVSGGNYGWIINKSEETKELINAIKNGETADREPVYSQTAVSRNKNDIGNTYIEIDMTQQHLWYYKNGAMIADGDVVTGNAALNYSTPVGTYRINYKEKNATLKGEDYSSKVTYWLPFNNNIGVHDASWRDKFGGQIYLTNGSHGCVNAPYALAEKIFNNIESGIPVVCYYE
ncbi:MAG: peptidoglycan binding domain-containing protein [Clostridium sp.]|nr:peptidoglycan binding domain-containing protein [Clostridium sp.]